MNPSSQTTESVMPSLFQIAAQIEDFIPGQTPFPELLQHAEKLAAVLKNAVTRNHAVMEPEKPVTIAPVVPKRAARAAITKSRKPSPGRSPEPSHENEPPKAEPLKAKFYLEAPAARSVKLAADFTQWDKSPLEMIKIENGLWYTAVPLAPGHYSYRFIVDGQWCDDPRSLRRVPNPFGTANAVIDVT